MKKLNIKRTTVKFLSVKAAQLPAMFSGTVATF